MKAFIGVDVGTGSARAGVFDSAGTLLGSHKQDILMWREPGDIAEQSSDDIWKAVCASVRMALEKSEVASDDILGIGFDAACSMVVLDQDMRPISISASGDTERNVIVWMDHRATDQAARINATGHAVLDYVGGRISPEMQTPKLIWLKENMPQTFDAAGQFFDLPDFLTWAATGSLQRSACTVSCKWTYLAHENRWDDSYFNLIGLPDIPAERYMRIGQEIVPPGTALTGGLSPKAAAEMGLPVGTPVGAALIDAHAGGVGTVGADPKAGPQATMAYVFGTSACTMATSTEPRKVPGIWGPYLSAMVPGMWLSEGGQSAAGEAIAHLTLAHPMGAKASELARSEGLTLQGFLLQEVEHRSQGPEDAAALAGAKVVVPDLLGNRAPFADPEATGVVSGLTLAKDLDDLVATYVAAILGVGYGLRQIMEAQADHGVCPKAITISGGAGESKIVRQLLADSSGYPILSTTSPEPVLVGAAILGALACDAYATLTDAMAGMTSVRDRLEPALGKSEALHDARYHAFQALQRADFDLRSALGQMAASN